MNWKESVLNLSKKIILVMMLFISGCTTGSSYHLDYFYDSTCPRCKALISQVIETLDYSNLIITGHDIDEEESLDLYAKTISLLEGYTVDETTGNVPLIVFDGNFVKMGYDYSEKELLLENIDKAMNGETIIVSKDYYLFKENETLY